jgi:multidrug efflux system outer membrane protein
MRKGLILALILLVAQSCVMYPRYKRPSLDIPCAWRFDANTASTATNYRWWFQFEDPVLNAFICQGLHYNNDIKIAVATVMEYYAQLGITNSQFWPQINANGIYERTELATALTPLLPGQARTFNVYELFLTLDWELDFWGKLQSMSEVSFRQLMSQVQAQREVVLTVVTAIASSYIHLREYDEELQISRDTLKSRQESFKLATYRFLGGQTSELEVAQSESEVEDAKAQVIQFELLVALEEDRLSVLVGMNPRSIMRGRTLEQLPTPPTIPAGLPSQLLCQRPDIMAAEQMLMAANAQIGVARAQFFPTISLTGLFGFESVALNNLFTNPGRTWAYGVNILQPIVNGGNLISQLDLANAQKCAAIYNYRQVVLEAFKDVDDALISHQKALELVKVRAKSVEVLQLYLHLATLQYNEGETDYLNVLDAERKLFQAQLDHAVAQSDTLLTVVALYKALGGGWVVDADRCLRK